MKKWHTNIYIKECFIYQTEFFLQFLFPSNGTFFAFKSYVYKIFLLRYLIKLASRRSTITNGSKILNFCNSKIIFSSCIIEQRKYHSCCKSLKHVIMTETEFSHLNDVAILIKMNS